MIQEVMDNEEISWMNITVDEYYTVTYTDGPKKKDTYKSIRYSVCISGER